MFTTMKKLMSEVSKSFGIVAQYKSKVIVIDTKQTGGFIAALYEFVEKPEDIGVVLSECRLIPYEKTDVVFETAGQAVAWCLERMD